MVLPAILGGLATGIGSSAAGFGLSKLFGGGGGAQFQPSPMMEAFGNYGLAAVEPSQAKKKADIAQFRSYVGAGDRGAGEEFLRSMMEMYPGEKKYAKAFKRSLGKEVNLGGSAGWNTADQIYQNAGLTFTGDEFQSMAERAQKQGIRGSAAFGDFLKQNLMAQGKIMTPAQEAASLIFGAPRRTAEGYYTNDYMSNRGV
jgi:hypothetical protein